MRHAWLCLRCGRHVDKKGNLAAKAHGLPVAPTLFLSFPDSLLLSISLSLSWFLSTWPLLIFLFVSLALSYTLPNVIGRYKSIHTTRLSEPSAQHHRWYLLIAQRLVSCPQHSALAPKRDHSQFFISHSYSPLMTLPALFFAGRGKQTHDAFSLSLCNPVSNRIEFVWFCGLLVFRCREEMCGWYGNGSAWTTAAAAAAQAIVPVDPTQKEP